MGTRAVRMDPWILRISHIYFTGGFHIFPSFDIENCGMYECSNGCDSEISQSEQVPKQIYPGLVTVLGLNRVYSEG